MATRRLLISEFLLTMFVILGPVHAADGASPQRVLHFSKDYSIGDVFIEDEAHDRSVRAINLWVRDEDWQFHAKARGDVTIPAGHRVRLQMGPGLWEDHGRAEDLVKLGPDAIYSLSFRPDQWPTESDWLLPSITGLTGLKELDCRAITVSGKTLDALQQLKQLEFLWAPPGLTNRGVKAISKVRSLKTLFLLDDGNQFSDQAIGLLAALPRMEELILAGQKLTDEALAKIADLKELRCLYLVGSFSNGAMVYLKELPNLKVLRIQIEAFNDTGMRIVSGFSGLERFSAHYMSRITDEGVGHLKKMPRLKMLDLKSAKLTDTSLKMLGQMPQLEYLDLPYGFTDEGMAELAGLKNLKFLWICTASVSVLGDRSMQVIGQLTQLEQLHIGGTNITDEGVQHLRHLRQLQELGLSFVNTTDQSLPVIGELSELENVSLSSRNSYSTDGLNGLNRLTALKYLSCRGTRKGRSALNLSGLNNLEYLFLIMDGEYDKETREPIYHSLLSDEDTACLKSLDRLNFLCFGGTEISDAGFKTIANMKGLKTLQLSGPTRLTDQAFAAFPSDSPVGLIRINCGHFDGEGLQYLTKLDDLDNLELTSDIAFDQKKMDAFKQKTKISRLKLIP